jgi:two-component system cell cycle response regulator DivK
MTDQKTVLLIDDDSRNIFALTAVLKAKGFHILSALSAQEGVQFLQKNKGIKVVLLDMMMPDMDGYETLRFIRSDEKISNVPVIAVTAQAMIGDREKCLEAGANEYVSKPIDVDFLLQILNRYN